MLPVDIIDKCGEGGQIQHYITDVLNIAFTPKYQNQLLMKNCLLNIIMMIILIFKTFSKIIMILWKMIKQLELD